MGARPRVGYQRLLARNPPSTAATASPSRCHVWRRQLRGRWSHSGVRLGVAALSTSSYGPVLIEGGRLGIDPLADWPLYEFSGDAAGKFGCTKDGHKGSTLTTWPLNHLHVLVRRAMPEAGSQSFTPVSPSGGPACQPYQTLGTAGLLRVGGRHCHWASSARG